MEAEQEIREKVLQLLARRDYSVRELVTRLAPKFDPDLVDQVLASFAERGLQSDQRFAENLVRGRINQGHGPIRIQAELKQKGISQPQIEQALEANPVDWYELAVTTCQRRFGSPSSVQDDLQEDNPTDIESHTRRKADLKARAKQMRFLQYRGFTMDQAQYALNFDLSGR